MSTYMTAMSEFFEARMTRGRAAKVMSLNMSVLDRMSSTWELVMGEDALLPKYGTPRSLRKNLDWGRHGAISLDDISSIPLKYCSIKVRSLGAATELVVMVIPFQDSQMQSTLILDL